MRSAGDRQPSFIATCSLIGLHPVHLDRIILRLGSDIFFLKFRHPVAERKHHTRLDGFRQRSLEYLLAVQIPGAGFLYLEKTVGVERF